MNNNDEIIDETTSFIKYNNQGSFVIYVQKGKCKFEDGELAWMINDVYVINRNKWGL